MEFLPNGFTLEAGQGSFPLSTDSMLLADFVKLPKNARVLDLGAGCGTLGILLCAKDENAYVTGVEISEASHAAAMDNIRRNHLENRMESICADLRAFGTEPDSYCVCVSNPPYFSGGPASKEHAAARREDHCTPAELFTAAAKALKFGGDLYIVHKPERLAELIAWGAKKNLEAKRLRLVRHKPGSEISLILLSFRKGGKPGLQIDEVTLFESNNEPTPYYKGVYHIA